MDPLAGYNYCQQLFLTGQSGAGVNHQVRLTIGSNSGSPNLYGHSLSWPHDIRFTDNDGVTQLKYYIEDLTEDPIVVWVLVTDNLDSNQSIYVHYGKTGDTTTSNYADTFPWAIQDVETTTQRGAWNSIVVDYRGYPYIAYRDNNRQCLRMAMWNGSSFTLEEVRRVTGLEGFATSIALNASNYPVIAYYHDSAHTLCVVAWNGSSWTYHDAIATTGAFSSSYYYLRCKLVIFADGHYGISFQNTSAMILGYAHYNGSTWSVETLDSVSIYPQQTWLCKDGSGYPRIVSPSKLTTDDIKYKYWDGDSWENVDLDSPITSCPYAYNGLSMALKPTTEYPILAYQEGLGDPGLCIVEYDGASWTRTNLDPVALRGQFAVIKLDGRGRPYIGYHAYNDKKVKVAYKVGASWVLEEIATSTNAPCWVHMDLDPFGFPQISYAPGGATTYVLKHAYRRKFCYPEPSFASAGEEEGGGGPAYVPRSGFSFFTPGVL